MGIQSLRGLLQEFRNTRDPSHISLATSLERIITSIVYVWGYLSNVSNNKDRTFDYCRMGLDKNQFKDISKSNKDLFFHVYWPQN